MKSRGTRATQAGGPNITAPIVLTTSQTFTPNQYPFKFKVYMFAGGQNSGYGYTNSTTNYYYVRYGGGGGSGGHYISASTETLTSGVLTFTIGAAPVTTGVAKGGATTVVRNDNAVTYTTANTPANQDLPGSANGGSGSSGGGGSGAYRVSNNTGNSTNYVGGYGGFDGGSGAAGYHSGGTGTTNFFVSANGVTSLNRGNDTRLPGGGQGYNAGSGDVPTGWAGIVISGTTYLAASSYAKGGQGYADVNLDDWVGGVASNPARIGGAGVAVLEPVP